MQSSPPSPALLPTRVILPASPAGMAPAPRRSRCALPLPASWGSRPSPSCTCSASVFIPRRMSVTPLASHTRTPTGTGIIAPPPPQAPAPAPGHAPSRRPPPARHRPAQSRCVLSPPCLPPRASRQPPEQTPRPCPPACEIDAATGTTHCCALRSGAPPPRPTPPCGSSPPRCAASVPRSTAPRRIHLARPRTQLPRRIRVHRRKKALPKLHSPFAFVHYIDHGSIYSPYAQYMYLICIIQQARSSAYPPGDLNEGGKPRWKRDDAHWSRRRCGSY